MAKWGWIHSTKQVADFENITLTEGYKLNVIHYLNTLAYLKDYNKQKDLDYKKWEKKQNQ